MRYRDATSPHGLKLIANLCKDGYTDKEIAAKLGVTDVSLSRWRRRGAKLRAVMAAARGKNENVPKVETSADKKPRTPKTSEKKLYKPAICKRQWNLATVKETIQQWEYERRRDKLPLTRESLCQMLGLDIGDFRKITTNQITIDAPPEDMTYNAVTETIQPAIVDMIKSADRAILSELADRCLAGRNLGAIFLLKNHYDYTDKQTLAVSDSDYIVRWEQPKDGDGKTYILTDPSKHKTIDADQ